MGATTGGQASLVARNTAYNVIGQLIATLIGVVAIPVLSRSLDAPRFGLLALIWVIYGQFSALDLGLGRATTKFVGEHLARRDESQMRRVATLSVVCQTLLGILSGALLALLTPTLLHRILHIPAGLEMEARGAFLYLAVSVPFVVLSLSMRAILEAAQRFDLVNLIRTPSSALVFVVPAVTASFGGRLPLIVLLLLATRIATCWATDRAIRRALPSFRWELRPSWPMLRPLLQFGGWVAVSNAVSPVLGYLERFVLGSLVGLAAVAYYVASFEGVTRLLLVPVALAAALFPALAAALARGEDVQPLVSRSVRYLLLTLAAPVFIIAALSRDLLDLWLGPVYATQGAAALSILALGVLVNALAHVPYVYLLGRGRSDLPAKFHLLELPLYFLGAWLLIGAFGVAGAAMAWTLRVTVDATLLFLAMGRWSAVSPLGERGGRAVAVVVLLTVAALGSRLAPSGLAGRIPVAVALTLGFAAAVWRFVLDDGERAQVRRVLT